MKKYFLLSILLPHLFIACDPCDDSDQVAPIYEINILIDSTLTQELQYVYLGDTLPLHASRSWIGSDSLYVITYSSNHGNHKIDFLSNDSVFSELSFQSDFHRGDCGSSVQVINATVNDSLICTDKCSYIEI